MLFIVIKKLEIYMKAQKNPEAKVPCDVGVPLFAVININE